MIVAEDFRFHARDPQDRSWTETLFLIFAVPQANISGSIYALTRPNLGVCHSSIEIHKGICFHPWQIHHLDSQMHLPCPADFSDFTLDNGLSFKAHDARDAHFHYEALNGNCSFDIDYRSICQPFDSHDPADNVLIGKQHEANKLAGYDGWNNGHMESVGRSSGELVLCGKRYRIDSIDGMNKSWGPRPDWGQKGATWIHVSLGEDFSAFLVLSLEFQQKEIVYGAFKFGFLSLDGRRRGLVAAEMTAQRRDLNVTNALIRFTDDQGETYEVTGTTIAGAPWYSFNPASAAFQTLMRFEYRGRVGFSHIADFCGNGFLSAGMADRFAD